MDVNTLHVAASWNIPGTAPTEGIFAHVYECPLDPRAWNEIATQISAYSHYRVKKVVLQLMPGTPNCTGWVAMSNADTASSVSSNDYSAVFNHMEDWVYKAKGVPGQPVRLSRVFNNLPWCRVKTNTNDPEPTVSIAGAWYNANATKARSTMWASIDFECYGTAKA